MRTSRQLARATFFLTLTTLLYTVVGLYGNWQYECVELFNPEIRAISNITDCDTCSRYLYTPFVTEKTSSKITMLLYLAVIYNQIGFLFGVIALYNGYYQKRLSFTSTLLVVCVMTSSSTYSLWFDTGRPNVTLAISTTLHVSIELYFSILSIINLFKLLSPTNSVVITLKEMEKSKKTLGLISLIIYWESLVWFLTTNSTSVYFMDYAIIKYAGVWNILSHHFMNLLWVQYCYLPDDDDFVLEIEKSLGSASDYIFLSAFGIHTLGTTLHPLVDSQISLTGNHGCYDEKTDMIILHVPLSMIESSILIYYGWSVQTKVSNEKLTKQASNESAINPHTRVTHHRTRLISNTKTHLLDTFSETSF